MVHQYQLNGYNIVLDSCSGSIHAVDEVAYDIIALYPDCSEAEIIEKIMAKYSGNADVNETEIKECIADIKDLAAAGKLYTKDNYEDHAFDFKNTVLLAYALHRLLQILRDMLAQHAALAVLADKKERACRQHAEPRRPGFSERAQGHAVHQKSERKPRPFDISQ